MEVVRSRSQRLREELHVLQSRIALIEDSLQGQYEVPRLPTKYMINMINMIMDSFAILKQNSRLGKYKETPETSLTPFCIQHRLHVCDIHSFEMMIANDIITSYYEESVVITTCQFTDLHWIVQSVISFRVQMII